MAKSPVSSSPSPSVSRTTTTTWVTIAVVATAGAGAAWSAARTMSRRRAERRSTLLLPARRFDAVQLGHRPGDG